MRKPLSRINTLQAYQGWHELSFLQLLLLWRIAYKNLLTVLIIQLPMLMNVCMRDLLIALPMIIRAIEGIKKILTSINPQLREKGTQEQNNLTFILERNLHQLSKYINQLIITHLSQVLPSLTNIHILTKEKQLSINLKDKVIHLKTQWLEKISTQQSEYLSKHHKECSQAIEEAEAHSQYLKRSHPKLDPLKRRIQSK